MGSLEMSKAAFTEAGRLGHSWVGPEHGLLAILRGDPTDPARMALEEAGLEADRFERWYVERIERSDPKPKRDPDRAGISPNPAWYGVAGRAEGLAAGVGVSDVRPVDLLLALLWDTTEWLPVRGLGVSREDVAASLGRSGVTLPATPLPALDRPLRNPIRVDFPKSALGDVVEILKQRHPPGSGLRTPSGLRSGTTSSPGRVCSTIPKCSHVEGPTDSIASAELYRHVCVIQRNLRS